LVDVIACQGYERPSLSRPNTVLHTQRDHDNKLNCMIEVQGAHISPRSSFVQQNHVVSHATARSRAPTTHSHTLTTRTHSPSVVSDAISATAAVQQRSTHADTHASAREEQTYEQQDSLTPTQSQQEIDGEDVWLLCKGSVWEPTHTHASLYDTESECIDAHGVYEETFAFDDSDDALVFTLSLTCFYIALRRLVISTHSHGLYSLFLFWLHACMHV
jgi:hypothetical protein